MFPERIANLLFSEHPVKDVEDIVETTAGRKTGSETALHTVFASESVVILSFFGIGVKDRLTPMPIKTPEKPLSATNKRQNVQKRRYVTNYTSFFYNNQQKMKK